MVSILSNIIILGLLGSWIFVSWCISIKNKEFDKGDFLPKFLASVLMLAISIGMGYGQYMLINQYKEEAINYIALPFITLILGNAAGSAFAILQEIKRKKDNK